MLHVSAVDAQYQHSIAALDASCDCDLAYLSRASLLSLSPSASGVVQAAISGPCELQRRGVIIQQIVDIISITTVFAVFHCTSDCTSSMRASHQSPCCSRRDSLWCAYSSSSDRLSVLMACSALRRAHTSKITMNACSDAALLFVLQYNPAMSHMSQQDHGLHGALSTQQIAHGCQSIVLTLAAKSGSSAAPCAFSIMTDTLCLRPVCTGCPTCRPTRVMRAV
jgi:hypothetical protein